MKRLLASVVVLHAALCLAQDVEQAAPQAAAEPVRRLTMTLDGVPLRQAVESIAIETALPLRLATGGQPDRKVSFQVQNVPVAHAIAQFLEAADLHVQSGFFAQSSIMLAPGGPVRVMPVDDGCVLVLQSVTIVADRTVNMRRSGGQSERNLSGHRTAILDFAANFESADRVSELKRFKASLHVLAATRYATVKLESPDLTVGESAGDEQLRVAAVAVKNGTRVNVTVSGNAVASYLGTPRSDIFRNGATRAFDPAGKPLTNLNYVVDRAEKGQISVRISADTHGREESIAERIDRIEVVVPLEARYIDVPVVLQDFKMP